jgi:hypothetical protein
LPLSSTARGRHRAAGFNDLYVKFLIAYLTLMATQVIVFFPQSDTVKTLNLLASFPRMVLLLVVSGIFLYRAWAQIQDGIARTTPGKAVGYRFIPFFNFYWEFVAVKGLAEDIEHYAHARKIAIEPIPRRLPLSYCILMCVGAGVSMVVAFVAGFAAGMSRDPAAIASANQVAGIVGFLLGIPAAVALLLLFKKIAQASDAIAEAKLTAAAAGVGPTKDGTVAIATAIVGALGAGLTVVEKAIDEGHH